jgi:hypothetical protein
MLDKRVFIQGITMLCEVWGRTQSKLLFEAYYLAVQDMAGDAFERAIQGIISDRTLLKMPLPAEIGHYGRASAGDAALLAYDYLIRAVREQGAYKSVTFEDKTIHACVVAMGGWQRICDTTIEEWKWLQKDFLKLYQAFNNQHVNGPERLVGIHEQTNAVKGVDEPVDTIRIGSRRPSPQFIQGVAVGHG